MSIVEADIVEPETADPNDLLVDLDAGLVDEEINEDLGAAEFEETPLFQEYKKRVRQNRDLTVLVTDWQNERGTGKSTLSVKLASRFDRTDEGLTPDKAALSPERMIRAYSSQPKGSGLILDEAEAGLGSRDAMTKTNKVMSKIVSMARVKEKYVIFNMPASSHVDKRILDLADFWIIVKDRGYAPVYRLKKNPFKGKTYPKREQVIEWNAGFETKAEREVYKALSEEKDERLDNGGPAREKFITEAEAEEKREQAVEQERRRVRDAIIARMLASPKVEASQTAIGQAALGMSQSHVAQIKQSLHTYPIDGLPDE